MSTLSPTSAGRRSPLPAVLAVVLALAIGVAGGWWFAGRGKGSAVASPTTSTSCSTHASAAKTTAKPIALPNPRTIKVNVYNATARRGLARATSLELAARAFVVGTVANDPLNKVIQGTAEIRYGPRGARAAKVVAAQVPNPVMVPDTRKDASVDFVVGELFSSLNTIVQAQAQLTQKPSPTGTPC